MTTTAPNSAVKGGIKIRDPRIISPEIKVVYPSENKLKDQAVSEVQSTTPSPQVLPVANPTTVPTKESTAVTTDTITTTSTTEPVTVEPPKKPTWKDILKENAGLFIAVTLISVGIGFLIGKKL